MIYLGWRGLWSSTISLTSPFGNEPGYINVRMNCTLRIISYACDKVLRVYKVSSVLYATTESLIVTVLANADYDRIHRLPR
jgi:hypothetical protein